jgi:hypothetical protein
VIARIRTVPITVVRFIEYVMPVYVEQLQVEDGESTATNQDSTRLTLRANAAVDANVGDEASNWMAQKYRQLVTLLHSQTHPQLFVLLVSLSVAATAVAIVVAISEWIRGDASGEDEDEDAEEQDEAQEREADQSSAQIEEWSRVWV